MGYQCPLFYITIFTIITSIFIIHFLNTVNCLNGSNNGKIILNNGDDDEKGFKGKNIWSILKRIDVYSNSLIINWIIKSKESVKLKNKFEWIIKLRKFGTNEINTYYYKDEVNISLTKLINNYTYSVKNLHSSTGYEICIESEEHPIEDNEKIWISYKLLYDNKFNDKNNLIICKEIITENDKSWIITMTIIIIITSIATALVICLMIWCYFRIGRIKKRKNISKYVSGSYSKTSFLSPSSSTNNTNELKNYTKIYKWTDDKEDGNKLEYTNAQNNSGNDNQSTFKDIKGSLKIFYQPKTSFRKNRMGSITKFTKNDWNKKKKQKDRFSFNEKFVNFDFKTFEDINKDRKKKELKSTL